MDGEITKRPIWYSHIRYDLAFYHGRFEIVGSYDHQQGVSVLLLIAAAEYRDDDDILLCHALEDGFGGEVLLRIPP